MRLDKVGEFGLIKLISGRLSGSKDVIKGVGDDTAVIKYKKDTYLLFTTDMLIEGVHFRLDRARPSLIGRKALAVNISDIAAMGGVPRYAVVAVGMPSASRLSLALGILGGIEKLARKFKIDIVGGDTNKSNKLIINISLIGEVKKRRLALRSRAKAGDAIFVTGTLGGSLRSRKHLNFTPRIKEAGFLVRNFEVSAMIDVSDGLAGDILRIAESSNVGAIIDKKRIPVSGNYSVKNALFDGEDFELLFTIPEKCAGNVIKKWPYAVKLTRIGKITKKKKVIELITDKGVKKITGKGFRHF